MDEMGKHLVKDKYPPEPAKQGQVAREDYPYEKEGRANLFVAYEPRGVLRWLTSSKAAEILSVTTVPPFHWTQEKDRLPLVIFHGKRVEPPMIFYYY